MRTNRQNLQPAIRDGITRAVGAVGLLGIALIHTIDAPGHFVGGPDTWLGIAYVALIAGCLSLAAGLVFIGDRRIWLASAGLVVLTLIGFVLSRITGLPGDAGDIGNWGEALGIASLFVEGSFLMLTSGVLGLHVCEPAQAIGVQPERAPSSLDSLAA